MIFFDSWINKLVCACRAPERYPGKSAIAERNSTIAKLMKSFANSFAPSQLAVAA